MEWSTTQGTGDGVRETAPLRLATPTEARTAGGSVQRLLGQIAMFKSAAMSAVDQRSTDVANHGRVRRWRGARRPVFTPCPPNRTCGSPASGSPVGSCNSHTERQFGAASSHRRSPAVPVALRGGPAGAGELAPLCQPERQVLLWTETRKAALFEPETFPIFVLHASLGRYYEFPNDRGEGFKIGKYHHRLQPVPDPDRLDRECSPEDEAAVREGIAAYFPEANGPTRRMVACMFTNSPDEHFILDRHPAMDDVFIAAGFSGHGYKFCSVIGRIMADFCVGQEGRWGFGGFGLREGR